MKLYIGLLDLEFNLRIRIETLSLILIVLTAGQRTSGKLPTAVSGCPLFQGPGKSEVPNNSGWPLCLASCPPN